MKIKYIVDYKKYTFVECETEEEVKAIQELNKDMEAFIKSEQRYHERTTSMDHVRNSDGDEKTVEYPDETIPDTLSNLINKERLNVIYEAIKLLTARQKEIFLMVCIDNLTYKTIGEKLGINEAVAFRHYKKAETFIKNYVKKLDL